MEEANPLWGAPSGLCGSYVQNFPFVQASQHELRWEINIVPRVWFGVKTHHVPMCVSVVKHLLVYSSTAVHACS